jgi:hypothetical protein
MPENFGTFHGQLRTDWLDDGRKMKLVKDFGYTDPGGGRWLAPKGSVVDGASIPRFLWTIVGGPLEGKYRNASVIHDVACVEKTRPADLVHLCFYYAMRATGVGVVQAKILYAGVYVGGPRWTTRIEIRPASNERGDRMHLATLPKNRRGGFRSTSMVVSGDTDSTDLLRASGIQLPQSATTRRITLLPPRRTLHEADFDELKTAIEKDDLSLEEIRAFTPRRGL